MRNWLLKKPNLIALLVIITGLFVFGLMISTAETKSEFTSLKKHKYQGTSEFKAFRKNIRLRLTAGYFDPLTQTKPAGSLSETFKGKRSKRQQKFFIIQFGGPITDTQKYEMEDLGIRIFDYLPDFAFIVKMNDRKREAARLLSGVRWIGSYKPSYRIAPTITQKLSIGEISTGNEYVITLFDGEDAGRVVPQIEQLGAEVLDISSHGTRAKIKIQTSAQDLEFVANIIGVRWIEPAPAWKINNNEAATIMDAYDVWNAHNLYGAGQIVAVADTGLDQGSELPASLHDDFEDGNGVSRVLPPFDRVGDFCRHLTAWVMAQMMSGPAMAPT
jgi:hypothetical protein